MADSHDFWVIVAKGFHPFPSRTRKLSPTAPMVLHARVCGRVGSCPIKQQKPRPARSPGLFAFRYYREIGMDDTELLAEFGEISIEALANPHSDLLAEF